MSLSYDYYYHYYHHYSNFHHYPYFIPVVWIQYSFECLAEREKYSPIIMQTKIVSAQYLRSIFLPAGFGGFSGYFDAIVVVKYSQTNLCQ